MKKNFLVGKFWDPNKVMDALKQLQDNAVHVHDVYSPFPIHGIEPYLNIKRSRLTIAAFIYGCMGFTTALMLMGLIYGLIWPMNIGGKPSLAVPDAVPITFELTVLFAAHGMVLTFFIVGQYWPGKKAKLFDERQTDDVFVVAIDKNKIADEAVVIEALTSNGAYEVTEKEL
ncbi:DUF3341 domain-containing protein [Pontibacter sp. G13]|uniref:DUF3341 domain-containing protein n=1 Tax=Pontibacter sp. G13 TaxID=3074898 RepID=UPI00288B76E6|nr:DUF3341 domain-containing protein [Pontibacter sp. G13]WNJ16601.1 DUF3341 domain-containing protein [Pontibacter sp. G13]